MNKEIKQAQQEAKKRLLEMGLLQEVAEPEVPTEDLQAKVEVQNEEIIDLAEKLVKTTEALEVADAEIAKLKLELEKQQGTPKQK